MNYVFANVLIDKLKVGSAPLLFLVSNKYIYIYKTSWLESASKLY
jgi:hypothetical protein